ncbi:hypothetical protein D3C78_1951940 [compost metagenome]
MIDANETPFDTPHYRRTRDGRKSAIKKLLLVADMFVTHPPRHGKEAPFLRLDIERGEW